MIVIADASPLNYLVLIGQAEILARHYGQVVIPLAVLRELQHPETPDRDFYLPATGSKVRYDIR